MSHHRSQITGTGSHLPTRIVPNQELEKLLNTTGAWIKEKIGIEERRFAAIGEGPSDLAVKAAEEALKAANKKSTDVDCILFATSTSDYCAPGSGVLLQKKLGCHRIPAFDINNTSPGFLFALEMGDNFIKSGKYACILVVGAEVHSTALDMTSRGRMMSVIFGDGAGAVVLEPTEAPHGILSTRLHSDGSHFDKLWCEAPASVLNPRITPELVAEGRASPTMDGRYVFSHAVDYMSLVCEEILIEQEFAAKDLDWVVPHQANLRIIEEIATRLQVPMKKVVTTIQKTGNTSAASIPVALDSAVRAGKITKGNLLLLTSFGSGFSWGAGLVRW